ncbi:MAG: MXAN_6640 family putative metalloprotease [Actinomycetota bacterium]
MKRLMSMAVACALAATGSAALGAQPATKTTVRSPRPRVADALERSLERGEITEAEYALQRALALLHPSGVDARFADVPAPDPRAATTILRDLGARLDELPPSQRRRAEALLARPTDGAGDDFGDGYTADPSDVRNSCTAHACVHWVESTEDAPAPKDGDGDTIPNWVETTKRVVEHVWTTEVGRYNFRAPKSDASSTNHGPNDKLDVYLADIGNFGLFGYVATDDPNASRASYKYWDLSAYMVVDNDFAANQFFGTSGLAALRVTVAHEFFHAVQFAYDASEDIWFLEGTATWMEDQVYDRINDNLNYLAGSALRFPGVPLDYFSQGFQYGNWIFWRLLSENGCRSKSKPGIVRKVWERADGARGGPDLYSLKAVARTLKKEGSSLRKVFANFGVRNAVPKKCYEEGRSYARRGSVPIVKRFVLKRFKKRTGRRTVKQEHLTNQYVSFEPGTSLGRGARLRIAVDLPKQARGPYASVLVKFRSGRIHVRPVPLNKGGDGVRRVTFDRGKIKRVMLVLTNASARYSCWKRRSWSCRGVPRDDNRSYSFSARVT